MCRSKTIILLLAALGSCVTTLGCSNAPIANGLDCFFPSKAKPLDMDRLPRRNVEGEGLPEPDFRPRDRTPVIEPAPIIPISPRVRPNDEPLISPPSLTDPIRPN